MVAKMLNHLIRVGTLGVIDVAGRTHRFGTGSAPSLTVRLHDKALHWKLFFSPELHAGEAYMDGTLTVEDGSLYDFLELMTMNMGAAGYHPFYRAVEWVARMVRHVQQFNPIGRARGNVARHYDLSDALYDLFLDTNRQYSCAYFADGDEDLETAQEKKMRHIAAKLLLKPGHRVLDIGSGWGGLALYLAREMQVDVTGITLSSNQLQASRALAEEAGLAGCARFFLRDYREETGTYDRIVSVGMFEHVGVGHYRRFFTKVRDLLAADGVALLHTIGRRHGPQVTSPWIRKYIFPGGYGPALSEVVPVIERLDLYITDIEVLRLHYAQTLRQWRMRFLANRDQAKALYDERFCRMWEFYLASAEVAFRYLDHVVLQIQLAKRQDAVPLTRDYITESERALAETAGGRHSRAA